MTDEIMWSWMFKTQLITIPRFRTLAGQIIVYSSILIPLFFPERHETATAHPSYKVRNVHNVHKTAAKMAKIGYRYDPRPTPSYYGPPPSFVKSYYTLSSKVTSTTFHYGVLGFSFAPWCRDKFLDCSKICHGAHGNQVLSRLPIPSP